MRNEIPRRGRHVIVVGGVERVTERPCVVESHQSSFSSVDVGDESTFSNL